MEFKRKMKLTYDDYLQYNITHISANISKRLYWIIPAIFTLLIVIPTCRSMEGEHKGYIIFFAIITFSILLLIFWLLNFVIQKLQLFLTKRTAARMYTTNRQLQEEYDITINQNGIIHLRNDTEIQSNWKQIIKIVENENAIYIYFSRMRAFIILKRNLESPDELNALKQLCLQHVPYIIYKPLNKPRK